ncbi:unnamed protein product [Effrenium voratum]|nr:unnamed protein product [Effrenium voratum]
MSVPHKIFYWVETTVEHEYGALKPEKVATSHGVPAKELFKYWQKEIDCDKAVQTLPRTLTLIIFFALMLLSHEVLGPAQSIEKAIRFDIEENANFAFNGVGTFGNKNYQDVNNFADFYSWLRLGFSAVYLPQTKAVSEGSTLPSVSLDKYTKGSYLEYNRKVGPAKLSQEKAQAKPCDNQPLVQIVSDTGNITTSATDCHSLDNEYYIPPTEFDANFKTFNEDISSTVWLHPDQDMSSVIQSLEASDWLNSETQHWKLTLVTYNPDYDILVVTGIHFQLSRSGRIWKNITFMSLKMQPYANLWSLCWEILFFGSIMTIFVEELWEVSSSLCAASSRGRCRCFYFLRSYFTVWNLVDWTSIAIAFTLLGMWIMSLFARSDLQDVLGQNIVECGSGGSNCESLTGDLLASAVSTGTLVGRTSLVSSFYPFCILLRLFKAFSLQPRLAVVTRTLWASFADLMHFGIIFISVFVTFVFMAMGFFGRTVEGYGNFQIAFVTLFRSLMGDSDFDSMEDQVGRVIAGIFHITFMLTMLLILLNMLIAIIMDVYAETKRNAQFSDTVWHDVWDFLTRLYQKRTGHRVSIRQAKKAYLASLEDQAAEAEIEANNPKSMSPVTLESRRTINIHNVEESDVMVTAEILLQKVPKMTLEQAEGTIVESIKWFELTTPMEVRQEDVLLGIRQLQQVHGISPAAVLSSRTPSKQDLTKPKVQGEVDEKLQALAEQASVRDLLSAAMVRLDSSTESQRSKKLVAQMISSLQMIMEDELVDMRGI